MSGRTSTARRTWSSASQPRRSSSSSLGFAISASRPAVASRTATHREQEEVYVVVRGSGRMKLDDEIVEVKEWDVVRVPSGTWRGYESGSQGLEILVFGAPNLGENPRDDVEGQRDWWDE